jgi:hypothetical protein
MRTAHSTYIAYSLQARRRMASSAHTLADRFLGQQREVGSIKQIRVFFNDVRARSSRLLTLPR